MSWDIISIGDEAYLYRIFQFLAMLGGGSTNLYTHMMLAGSLVGLTVLLIKGSVSPKDFNPISFLWSILAFMVAFGHTTTVTLTDYHTGRVDSIDHIPFGTAVVGTLISRSGVEIYELFQQATGDVDGERLSPDYSLHALWASRTLTDSSLCGIAERACAFQRTAQNYIRDCVIPYYKGYGRVSSDSDSSPSTGWWNGNPMTAEDALAAIQVPTKFSSTLDPLAASTSTNTAQPNVPQKTCPDVYSDLHAASTDVSVTDSIARAYLSSAAGGALIDSSQQSTLSSSGGATDAANTILANALGIQSGMVGSSSDETYLAGKLSAASKETMRFQINSVLNYAFQSSQMSGSLTPSDLRDAAVIEQAVNARNESYSAQESLFQRSLAPLMTFYEGFTYGLAPFIALLLPIGRFGMVFAGRYLAQLVWLFLWLPINSFVGLFEVMAINRKMNALSGTSDNGFFTSIVGIHQIIYSVGDWISIGGYLSTAVIGMAGMLVYGGVAAFNSIAQSTHGDIKPDVSTLAPPVETQGAMLSIGSGFGQQGSQGAMSTSMPMRQYTQSSTAQITEQYSEQIARQAAVQAGMSESTANSASMQVLHNFLDTQSRALSQNQTYTTKEAEGKGRSENYGLNASKRVGTSFSIDGKAGMNVTPSATQDIIADGAAAIASDGMSLLAKPDIDLYAGVSVGGKHDSGSSTGISSASGFSVSRSSDKALSDSNSSASGLTTATSEGRNTSSGSTNTESLSKAIHAGLAASENAMEMMQQSNSTGSSLTVNEADIAGAFENGKNSGVLNRLSDLAHDLGLGKQVVEQQSLMQSTSGGHFTDDDSVRAIATMRVLDEFASSGTGDSTQSFEAKMGMSQLIQAVSPGWNNDVSVGARAEAMEQAAGELNASKGAIESAGSAVNQKASGMLNNPSSFQSHSISPAEGGSQLSSPQSVPASPSTQSATSIDAAYNADAQRMADNLKPVRDHIGELPNILESQDHVSSYFPGTHTSPSLNLSSRSGGASQSDQDVIITDDSLRKFTEGAKQGASKVLENFHLWNQ